MCDYVEADHSHHIPPSWIGTSCSSEIHCPFPLTPGSSTLLRFGSWKNLEQTQLGSRMCSSGSRMEETQRGNSGEGKLRCVLRYILVILGWRPFSPYMPEQCRAFFAQGQSQQGGTARANTLSGQLQTTSEQHPISFTSGISKGRPW